MWNPCYGAHFIGKETIHVDLNTSLENREPTSHFGGKVKHENCIPESIMPNIVGSFFYIKKSSHCMFFPVETFHNGLGKPEETIIARLILSET